MVGKHGMSQSLIDSVNQALEAHELIKMKFIDHKGQKKEITAAVAERTGSAVAGIIGNVAILYREHEDKEKRTIDLDAPRL